MVIERNAGPGCTYAESLAELVQVCHQPELPGSHIDTTCFPEKATTPAEKPVPLLTSWDTAQLATVCRKLAAAASGTQDLMLGIDLSGSYDHAIRQLGSRLLLSWAGRLRSAQEN